LLHEFWADSLPTSLLYISILLRERTQTGRLTSLKISYKTRGHRPTHTPADSGRWPVEGGAVARGRGPAARGGGGRWPARGAVSPGGPAVARRRPAAVFVRGAAAREEPVRLGGSRPSRWSSSAAGVRASRGGGGASGGGALPEAVRDGARPGTFRTLVGLDCRDVRRLDCRDAPPRAPWTSCYVGKRSTFTTRTTVSLI
jgi:hypothetical protein